MSTPLRPRPPETSRAIVPAPELAEWATASFLTEGSPLFNPEHLHLADAGILWLWAYAENKRQKRIILGDCSIPQPPTTGGTWGRAAYWQQVEDLYFEQRKTLAANPEDVATGERPDFVIRIYAPNWLEASDLSACALAEHELYHGSQDEDEYGQPKFSRATGLPIWAIKGHDCDEHLGIVERYGAATPDLERLRLALSRKPTVGRASIAQGCGTCRIAA